jgi:hypothetical protein
MNTQRPIYEIAKEIQDDWNNVYFGAVPYLRAMFNIEMLSDYYGQDGAKSVLLYFLSNARTWRGPTARRIKSELKTLLKVK